MAEAALAAGADQVWLLPSFRPPHKDGHLKAQDRQRLQMCQLLADDVPQIQVNTLELNKKLRYTADTLRFLKTELPASCSLVLLLGSDALHSLLWWKDAGKIMAAADIWAFDRNHLARPEIPGVRFLDTVIPAVSSTAIRLLRQQGSSIHGLVPEAVEAYITHNHLYESEVSDMTENTSIYVNVDKTVVKITGLDIKGLNIQQLEEILQSRLQTMTRIIGVTGNSLELDAYGISEDEILKDSDGLIKAISLADGIKATDVARLQQVQKIHQVDFDHIPPPGSGCIGERWVNT